MLGSLVQVMATSGILISYIFGIGLELSFWWRIMFAFPIIPAVLQLILFATKVRHDTPKWLAKQNDDDTLEAALKTHYDLADIEERVA
jgi:MFS family permease